MIPSKKSPNIERLIKNTAGIDRIESIHKELCIDKPFGCGQPITEFRDALSKKEYTISGLCQSCQDKIFG